MSYEQTEKVLFSADAFGRFGNPDESLPWEDEGRRYYCNIVGKYGVQVQAVLKKVAQLDIQAIGPLHGPGLTGERISRALERSRASPLTCLPLEAEVRRAARGGIPAPHPHCLAPAGRSLKGADGALLGPVIALDYGVCCERYCYFITFTR